MKQRAQKIMDRIDQLASITEEAGCVTRTYGTPAFLQARTLVQSWMNDAALQTLIDAIGNIRGIYRSENPNAKTFVIGSHIDTVVNAGKFDGPLGVIMGIDLAEKIIQSKTQLPFHLEVIGFCDEEGVRFQTTYLGSKVLAGLFDEKLLSKKDKNGITLKDAIQVAGGNVEQLKKSAIPKDQWLGYFEIHIEQGPVLYQKNIPVGMVSAIAGQYRAQLEFTGVAGHAGTVPMNMRNDALAAASEFILDVEKFAASHPIVATVGKLDVVHAAGNVIPGKVICSLDVRSSDPTVLQQSIDSIKRNGEIICIKRKIDLQWNDFLQTSPVACDVHLNKILESAIAQTNTEIVSLVSGAGHDAVPVSEVAPVCMLFVKCFEGISHNPREHAAVQDVEAAIAVADNFLNRLILKQA